MNQKELKELIEFLIEKDVAEFELERGDVKIRLRRGQTVVAHYPPAIQSVAAVPLAAVPVAAAGVAPAVSPPPPPLAAAQEAPEAGLTPVKSPIVGTFYESPSPGAPPFVKIGDHVDVGQVLCIVEAMKLLNEIEADVAGEIVKKMVTNGQPIEYGQELFMIRPAK